MSTESVVEQLCDAVVTELNAQHGFTINPITSAKQMLPRLDRANLTSLQIVVAPMMRRNSLLNRGGLKQLDCKIGIGFYQGIVSNENTELGPLMLLAEQVGEHFPLFKTHLDTG